jgi:cohesin loading factor subunit SCC2
MAYLRYTTEILAHLPYVNAEEPLLLIFMINRLVSHRGSLLLDEMKPSVMNIQSSDNVSMHNVNLIAMQSMCERSYVLGLLLNLKHFLKNLYTLSDLRFVNICLTCIE